MEEDNKERQERETAAGHWFWEEMEKCPYCGLYVHWEELQALIGTRAICYHCRVVIQMQRLDKIYEAERMETAWLPGLS